MPDLIKPSGRNPVPINGTTYEIELPLGDKAEIGDKLSANFKPNLKLKRWGEECSLNLSIPTTEKILPTIQGEKILWQGKDYGAEFYRATDGFKFNIILPKKPATNVFPLDFGSDNLRFSYQPPLTEEFKEGWSDEFQCDVKVTETQVTRVDDGFILVYRPENVVGSYAVYHATKGNMHPSKEEAEKYKAGKAFHWYRPLIYDNAGHTCWGILNVDPKKGLRTVTIPQEFLDSAVYPVTIDDTFGYTSEGGSDKALSVASVPYGYRVDGASAGSLTSMSAYVKTGGPTNTAKWGVYKINASNVLKDYTNEITVGTAYAWCSESTTQSYSLEASANYWLALYPNDAGQQVTVAYDSGYSYGYAYTASATYPTWPDPWSPSISGNQYYLSIYCTYTPSGGEAKTGSDSGTGTDAKVSENPVVTLSATETGSGADSKPSGQPSASLSGEETGNAVDAYVSVTQLEAKTGSDSGTGTDAKISYPAVAHSRAETGTGTESSILSSSITAEETANAVDAVISRILQVSESGAGVESSSLVTPTITVVTASDSGSGIESALLSITHSYLVDERYIGEHGQKMIGEHDEKKIGEHDQKWIEEHGGKMVKSRIHKYVEEI